jgi:hypothetical protein
MTGQNSPVAALLSQALQQIHHNFPLLEDYKGILQDSEEEI